MKELLISIAAAVVLLVAFLIIHAKNKKKKRQKQELQQLAEEKLREEALDQLILNQKAQNDVLKASSQQPYQATYTSTMNTSISDMQRNMGSKLILQVEEIGVFSRRNFMLDPEQTIKIGSGKDNTISLPGVDIDYTQCEVGTFSADRFSVYVRNVGWANKVILVRKKQMTPVNGGMQLLMNGDELIVADVKLVFTFIRTNQGGKR